MSGPLHQRGAVAVWLFGLVALVSGCPAQAVLQADAAPPVDASPQEDAAPDVEPDDAAADVDEVDAACATEAVETSCSDGCDNDGDGFFDQDDPDCVPTFLVTREPPDEILRWRVGDADFLPLHAANNVMRPLVDSSQVSSYGFAVKGGFPPGRGLYRFDPHPDPAAGPENVNGLSYPPGEVCVFAGQVIVAELTTAKLHAYSQADVTIEVTSATVSGATRVRACAADATDLYVVAVPASGADEIVRLSAALEETGRPGFPSGLAAEKTRILDLAYDRTSGEFFGLFVGASESNTAEVTPFAMGGAIGAPVTAPIAINNLGTFSP
jgi:hypothetical protein